MFKNLLKTAVRHILKHFGYSVLNILCLTLGITSALFLIIYVADEVSYDVITKKQIVFTGSLVPQNTGCYTIYYLGNNDNMYAGGIQTIELLKNYGSGI